MSVPLSTIKSALKIDYDDDDADLIRLREVAQSVVERRTQLKLQPGTESLYLAEWKTTLIPAFPFNGITHVRYQNTSNVQTTMPSGDYWLDQTDGPMPVIRFLESPAIYEGTAITVTYTAGYSSIPDPLVHCVISTLWELPSMVLPWRQLHQHPITQGFFQRPLLLMRPVLKCSLQTTVLDLI